MRACLRLLCLLPLLGAGAPPREVSADAERIVAQTFVPSPEKRVGEVRLIRRGDADVVETLLYTRLLRRVIGRIREKERENWGEGEPGHEDAARYAEALERVQRAIWKAMPKDEIVRDRRQKMWIDFALSPEGARVAIGSFEMDDAGGKVRMLRRETLAELDLSRSYVRRNMRLIAADSFGVEGAALEALLEPLPGLRGAELRQPP